ncbi:hypothetical protein N8I74_18530 [Chitiniphilus purpureus]|uniref:Uncharacterized protein n=1 Tax=Chitiniphilus purpureus TaxID=2981137 RepID=A0ABY6DLQ0_9NEIS|nr:hypothetical protein [Chitiniphilus sp. CD1]UXY15285.1 hypothetical protein N8I74_18530 [Chitiniphilus sp. CD1]
MYDCFYPDDIPAPRTRLPDLRRCLQLRPAAGADAVLREAERQLRALGFALEPRGDGSLLVFDLSVLTALALQQRWPTLIARFETPALCRNLRCDHTTSSTN